MDYYLEQQELYAESLPHTSRPLDIWDPRRTYLQEANCSNLTDGLNVNNSQDAQRVVPDILKFPTWDLNVFALLVNCFGSCIAAGMLRALNCIFLMGFTRTL